ncbi:hypothetical protein GII33_01145 [Gordonia pseudamarae]|jgi:energy-coupling factor transporter ATP-binding protein EcfA2|uniref:ABC transporter domain-containing protein n=1 Tax=Gordonia pseudamarae TaxID=2831662 RepID=A0ABX6IF26_9ACTN|nr:MULTISPECIES: hypothetical protein [Gordonia]MBD0023989.1 hypothetical protein [Gordonia sp. (in: high G+C Gram-positive bacteria)]QHN24783.1 hypothetical protein GII33_01145 [Gordonia pseudamarae]QHN33716.1 hypothetical protein GII31_01145 [Gordonia pseudamarae]
MVRSAITARAIAQSGPWGPVYGPIDLDIPEGGLNVLVGPASGGRTALLMTLAGRMKAKSGDLDVFGDTASRDIFRRAGMVGIEGLDAIYESVRVVDLVTEQLRWDAPWYTLVPRARPEDLQRVCGQVFGDLPLPGLDEYVEELPELDGLLLRIALGNTRTPPLLVVGAIDQVANDRDQRLLVDRLVALGARQTVVTASANPLPPDVGWRTQTAVPNLLQHHLLIDQLDARGEGGR